MTGDTTPCRITGVTFYTGLYPQTLPWRGGVVVVRSREKGGVFLLVVGDSRGGSVPLMVLGTPP